MWKRRDEEFVPTWNRDEERDRGKAWENKSAHTQIPAQKFTQHSHKTKVTTKEGIPMNQLSCARKACSFLKRRNQVITKTFESCFLKRQACKRDEVRLPPQWRQQAWRAKAGGGARHKSAEDTRCCRLSDRAPLTVLPGNTGFFSPELSWVWEEPGCFYLWYSRTKVVIYRKPESREEPCRRTSLSALLKSFHLCMCKGWERREGLFIYFKVRGWVCYSIFFFYFIFFFLEEDLKYDGVI